MMRHSQYCPIIDLSKNLHTPSLIDHTGWHTHLDHQGFQSFAHDSASTVVRLKDAPEIIERIPDRKMVMVSKKGVANKFVWTYEPEGEGTRMTVETEYTIPVPVLGKLAESMISKINQRRADIPRQSEDDHVGIR